MPANSCAGQAFVPGGSGAPVLWQGVAGPMLEIQSSPTDFLRLSAFEFTRTAGGNANGVITIGIGVPAAKGVPLTINGINASCLTVCGDDSGNNGTTPWVSVLYDWRTQPTAPTQFLRRQTFGEYVYSAADQTVVQISWRFQRGLVIPPSSSLVFWMINNNAGVFQLYDPVLIFEEG